MIVYVENPKNWPKKLLEQVSDYNKVAEYKVNIKKIYHFYGTSNEQMEFQI